jgi:hypothetical protein
MSSRSQSGIIQRRTLSGRTHHVGAAYAARMSNLNDPLEGTADGVRAVRVAERAGAEHLGASLYELQPGEEMVFHYHVQREELLIVLEGRLSLRSAAGGTLRRRGLEVDGERATGPCRRRATARLRITRVRV